jgi:HPt (histidine-containing phosphotransfer) domain-containing protein
MSDPKTDQVTVLPPSFMLQRKVGGPAGRLLTPSMIAKAEKSLEERLPEIRDDIRQRLRDLEDLARLRPPGAAKAIWVHAHELRGIAGTARLRAVGKTAHQLCRYLQGIADDFEPDPNLIATVTVTALHALRDNADADPMMETLVADCALAVDAQRRREGRPPSVES